MKNIFEILDKKDICYAVGIALFTFKSLGLGILTKDYFIIV
ncbi:unnamed protein product, partial [marine sediment metagenome]